MPAIQVTPLPIDRVIVERIDQAQTGKPDVVSFTITANTVESNPRRVQYQTVNAFEASMCERSQKLEIPIRIRWRQTQFGKDITRVEIER